MKYNYLNEPEAVELQRVLWKSIFDLIPSTTESADKLDAIQVSLDALLSYAHSVGRKGAVNETTCVCG